MTRLVGWCQGSLWAPPTQDSTSLYLFLTSTYVPCFKRRVYFIHIRKDTLPVYLIKCSLKPKLCLMAHDLFYFHLFVSLFLPRVHGIPTVWESNNQDSSQMPALYLGYMKYIHIGPLCGIIGQNRLVSSRVIIINFVIFQTEFPSKSILTNATTKFPSFRLGLTASLM